MRKKLAKGLVLSCVFLHCFQHKRELTVNQLLDSDQRLDALYGRHPHVLSNTLRRYFKQGLLYRNRDWRTGRQFYYGMTKKGFDRLRWMFNNNSKYYLVLNMDLVREVLTQIVSLGEKEVLLAAERRRQTRARAIKELEELVRKLESERR